METPANDIPSSAFYSGFNKFIRRSFDEDEGPQVHGFDPSIRSFHSMLVRSRSFPHDVRSD